MNKLKDSIRTMIKGCILPFYYVLTRVLPIKKNIIVFESNLGRNYSGNPKYIYEELVRQGLDKKYQCYFVVQDMSLQLPGQVKKLKRLHLHYFVVMAKAKLFVCDARLPQFFIKRRGAIFIETWHGTPLKKIVLDMEEVCIAGETSAEDYKQKFVESVRTWDYLISQNAFSTKVLRSAFAYEGEVLEIGYPRNDILVKDNQEEAILRLKKQLKLPVDKKIILYAPTWRDDEFYDKGQYRFNPKLDFSLLQEQLQEEYIIIVKYHYLVAEHIDWSAYQGFIYDFDMSFDISMLYLVSDLLITDYSSVMFDYSVLKRPMFFYCYDFENYKNKLRGFYFDFAAVAPGPISMDTRQLINDIREYEPALYEEKYKRFVDKFNHKDTGEASKAVVDLIEKLQG